MYVQSFVCLEGPVPENYKNKIKTIGNTKFPVKHTVQGLVNDHLYALTLTSPNTAICTSFVFEPVPVLPPVTDCGIHVNLIFHIVPESQINFSVNAANKVGRPPTVPIPFQANSFDLMLVSSAGKASTIVGLQFIVSDYDVATWKLYDQMELGTTAVSHLLACCMNILGHVSNNGKQINILMGQGSCSVSYPMPCGMVSKYNLSTPPKWLMRLFL